MTDIHRDLAFNAYSGNAAECRRLLELGANPRNQESQALYLAARHGHPECVKLLMPVSDPNANHSDALAWAIKNSHTESIGLLFPAAPQNAQFRALVACAETGQADAFRLLLSSSSWPAPSDSASLAAALGAAAESGHAECVEQLIAHCNPDAVGCSTLALAAGNGHAQCVELLIPFFGHDVKYSGALLQSCANGHVECAKLLLSRSTLFPADFHAAIDNGHAPIVAFLLGVEPALVNLIDPSALSAEAARKGHNDLASLLLSVAEARSIAEALTGAGVAEPSVSSMRL